MTRLEHLATEVWRLTFEVSGATATECFERAEAVVADFFAPPARPVVFEFDVEPLIVDTAGDIHTWRAQCSAVVHALEKGSPE